MFEYLHCEGKVEPHDTRNGHDPSRSYPSLLSTIPLGSCDKELWTAAKDICTLDWVSLKCLFSLTRGGRGRERERRVNSERYNVFTIDMGKPVSRRFITCLFKWRA